MERATLAAPILAALLLTASPALVACASEPVCGDVDDLEQQLADTDPDDPGYNDLVVDLAQAQADCNA